MLRLFFFRRSRRQQFLLYQVPVQIRLHKFLPQLSANKESSHLWKNQVVKWFTKHNLCLIIVQIHYISIVPIFQPQIGQREMNK